MERGVAKRKGNRIAGGFSLLEIMISLPILAIMSLALVSVATFTSRVARVVSNQIAAKNIAQSYFERMAIDDFERVTSANYPSVAVDSSPSLYLDSVRKSKCALEIVITGYGTADGGSPNTVVDSDAGWKNHEWIGNTVLLIGGTGRGQRARIVDNTASVLTLDVNLNPAPAAGSRYAINGGKTVRITTQWRYLGKAYSASIESIIVDWGPRR